MKQKQKQLEKMVKGLNSLEKPYRRVCPKCGKEIRYFRKYSRDSAELDKAKCRVCATPPKKPERDIAGEVFNYLTAIKFTRRGEGKSYWAFKCKCGVVKNFYKFHVTSGHTKSCGCIRKDYTGMKMGLLTAIKVVNREISNDRWLFQCACGNTKVTSVHSAITGGTKSCGCLVGKSRILPEGVVALNSLFCNYRGGANSRKISFLLTKQEVKGLVTKSCYYCGEPPIQRRNKSFKGAQAYNGIDRVDNSKGYVFENCVPCCARCNYAKGTMTFTEFKQHIASVCRNLNLHEVCLD